MLCTHTTLVSHDWAPTLKSPVRAQLFLPGLCVKCFKHAQAFYCVRSPMEKIMRVRGVIFSRTQPQTECEPLCAGSTSVAATPVQNACIHTKSQPPLHHHTKSPSRRQQPLSRARTLIRRRKEHCCIHKSVQWWFCIQHWWMMMTITVDFYFNTFHDNMLESRHGTFFEITDSKQQGLYMKLPGFWEKSIKVVVGFWFRFCKLPIIEPLNVSLVALCVNIINIFEML